MIDTRIKLLRETNGMTQADLARCLGITRSSINAWELGISVPSTQYIVALATLFRVSSDYLLGIEKIENIRLFNRYDAENITEELFSQILETIIHNLSRAGFKMVIAHGHGPSTHLFEAKQKYFEKKYGIVTATLFELGIQGDDGIQTDHAAANETSLTMALRPELVDIEKLPKDGPPVSVWGPDPRKFASVEYGEKVIYDNVDIICQRLIPIIEKLTKPVINLNYHHVKNMLRDKNEN